MTSRRLEPMVLRTDRLILREPDGEDAYDVTRLVGDWQVARWLARTPYPYETTDAHVFLREVVPVEAVWAVTLPSGTLLGLIGLHADAGARSAELGYWLGVPYWGSGYATEAVRRVLDYALEADAFERITAGCFVGNEGSGRVLEKLGFVETGRRELFSVARGRKLPHVDYVLPVGQDRSGP